MSEPLVAANRESRESRRITKEVALVLWIWEACTQLLGGVGHQVIEVDVLKAIHPEEAGVLPFQGMTQAQHAALADPGVFAVLPLPVKGVDAESQGPVEEVGLRKGSPDPVGNGADDPRDLDLLAPPEEVVLADLHHPHQAVLGAVTRTEAEGAGGALLDGDFQVHVVRGAPRGGGEVHIFKIFQAPQVLDALLEVGGGEEILLVDPEFPADHLVPGFDIAADVDAFEIDLFALDGCRR